MKKKIFLFAAFFAFILLARHFGLTDLLTLENLKSQREFYLEKIQNNFGLYFGAYFFLYILVAGASLPGAAVLTLGAGALFGFWPGLVLVSFASSIGACLSFSLARIFRPWFEKRFEKFFREVNQKIQREGWVYLLSLRIMPIFPYFVVNALVGLTAMPILRFYYVSQLGMLPATMIYVNAGTQISQINKISDFFTLKIILSFILIGIFPLLAKRAFETWRGKNAAL